MLDTNGVECGFEVTSINTAQKVGFIHATIKFDNEQMEYNYLRRTNENVFVVAGYSIHYRWKFGENGSKKYEVFKIVKKYETAGVKIKDTSKKTMAVKIKEEISNKQIELPILELPIKEEDLQVNGIVHHEKYSIIKTCLESNIPVYLAGPAGSGKNHTVEQIAKELGWPFYFSNSVQQEYKLTGFIDAGGKMHDTEFYKACHSDENCIFFLDEMDASIPEVLVLLNAAIANGYFEFPDGRVDFDKVHFVSAGNTVGSGADEMYTGRMVLDQATLDRFAIIEFDYSMNIEKKITGNNTELIAFIRCLREQATKKGIRATFSYRCMTMITKLEKAGMDLTTAMKISVLKGMDKDIINNFNFYSQQNKYEKAFCSCKQ